MKKLICLVLISSLGFISCKSPQKAKGIKSEEKINNETNSSSTVSESTDMNIYRISISFFSIGGGIDEVMKLKYDEFVKKFENQRGVKLAYEISHWGKEGETDYCFMLLELNSNDKDQFVNESKNILADSKTVAVKENTACKNRK